MYKASALSPHLLGKKKDFSSENNNKCYSYSLLSSLPPVECRKVGRGPTCGLRSLGFGHVLRTAILCAEGTEHGSPELYKTEFWAQCDVCVK